MSFATSMGPRPLRVQMLGLLPAILKPCGPACAQPFTNATVRALGREELDETPLFMRENADRAHEFAERLAKEFGTAIAIEVVGLDSPKGLWLGLRHGVGRGFTVIVGGSRVVRDPKSYEETRAAVAAAIHPPSG